MNAGHFEQISDCWSPEEQPAGSAAGGGLAAVSAQVTNGNLYAFTKASRQLRMSKPLRRWQRHHPHPEHGFVADIDVCVRLPDVRPRCAGWRANSAIGGADAWLAGGRLPKPWGRVRT